MRAALTGLLVLTAIVAGSLPAKAEQVDVELVLAVDVSGSMTSSELRIQRRGYVEAFRSPEIHNAIASGLIGKVAVMYVEWARADLKKVIVPWTIIDGPGTANAFADSLDAAPYANMRNTSISGAIRYGMEEIARNEVEGLRRVIDISGDGPNNQGGRVDVARDAAVATGHIINGLPLMADSGFNALGFNIVSLDDYFRACVIGGPGAFVIAVENWDAFEGAVRRKLVLELAATSAIPKPIQLDAETQEAVDCQIGEKLRGAREQP